METEDSRPMDERYTALRRAAVQLSASHTRGEGQVSVAARVADEHGLVLVELTALAELRSELYAAGERLPADSPTAIEATEAAATVRAIADAAEDAPQRTVLRAEAPRPVAPGQAVRALETARRYLREDLDGVAEWKDATEAVRHLAVALAEALPAAVAASDELPAAATTRAYWDAYLTGDPEPDVDELDEALRRNAP